MWVAGTVLFLAVGLAVAGSFGQRGRAVPSPPLWDIAGLGGTYTGIVGTIAGFSVASAIFIAGLDGVQRSPAFATTIGMLLVAFLILVFSALMYASTPNAADADGEATARWLAHALANLCGCLGLSVSWLALVPLLTLLGLPVLAGAFTWVLLVVGMMAGGWVALFAFHLTAATARACLAIPVVGFALAAPYRLVAVRVWPTLWPSTEAALHYAFVALAVAGLVFAVHLGLLLAAGGTEGRRWLRRTARSVALGCSGAYAVAVALVWFAVALP